MDAAMVAFLAFCKKMLVGALDIMHWWIPKLIIEFEDGPPFRLYESDELGFRKQHYAIRIRNNKFLNATQDQLRVVLGDIQYAPQALPLPIELRYRDRSMGRHHLNPPPDASIVDVLSFEIVVETDRTGFWIVFHGDDGNEYSIPCTNCRIRIDVSSSDQGVIPEWFELGLQRRPGPPDSFPRTLFFMRKISNS